MLNENERTNIEIDIEFRKRDLKENQYDLRVYKEYLAEKDDILKDIETDQKELKKESEISTHLRTIRDLCNIILNSRFESNNCPICKNNVSISFKNVSNEIKELNHKLDLNRRNRNGLECKIAVSKNLVQFTEKIPFLEDKIQNQLNMIKQQEKKLI